ncbi:MAG TPA: glycosyltransferase, partial [Sphingobacteriaceae bacterium]
KGITYTRGKWVYFLGADDRLLAGFAQLATKLENENTIYYGDMSYNGQVTSRKKYTAYRLSKETICHQAIIYPAKVFNYYSYNLNYPLVADWVLNLQLWGDKRFKFKFFPYVIADFSMAGASSTNKDLNFFRDRPGLIKKHLGLTIYLRFLLKQIKGSVYHFIRLT